MRLCKSALHSLAGGGPAHVATGELNRPAGW